MFISLILSRHLVRISSAPTLTSPSHGLAGRTGSWKRLLQTSAERHKTFEPDYLDASKSLPPTYPPMNIQLKGYDYHILESYQRYVHNLCENMGIDVSESWATPCATLAVKTFQVGGTSLQNSYELNVYERNVQLRSLRSIDAPILFDLLRRSLPEGVDVAVHENDESHYEARFIPDPFIEGLKQELQGMEEKKGEEMEMKEKKRLEKEAKKKEMLLASLDDDD